jgi:hypothetical protein
VLVAHTPILPGARPAVAWPLQRPRLLHPAFAGASPATPAHGNSPRTHLGARQNAPDLGRRGSPVVRPPNHPRCKRAPTNTHAGSPADAVARPSSIPLRAPVPPPGRFVTGLPGRERPQSPCCADSCRHRSAPPRRPGPRSFTPDPADRLLRFPPSPLPRFAPFRPVSRRRLLDFPAANVTRPEPIPAGRDGAGWCPTDSPRQATHRWRGRRLPAAHSRAHSQQGQRWSAPTVRNKPFVRPCTRGARLGAGDGG